MAKVVLVCQAHDHFGPSGAFYVGFGSKIIIPEQTICFERLNIFNTVTFDNICLLNYVVLCAVETNSDSAISEIYIFPFCDTLL